MLVFLANEEKNSPSDDSEKDLLCSYQDVGLVRSLRTVSRERGGHAVDRFY